MVATYGIGGALVGLSYLLLVQEDVRKVLGASLLAVGIFVAIAARDPIREIQWVRFAIVFALLFAGVSVYLGLFERDEFRSVLDGILIHGTFATLLLIFYPWQWVRDEGRVSPHDTRSGTVMEVTK